MDHWTNTPIDQWTNGPMDQWTTGPIHQWTNGPMDQWTNGPIYQRHHKIWISMQIKEWPIPQLLKSQSQLALSVLADRKSWQLGNFVRAEIRDTRQHVYQMVWGIRCLDLLKLRHVKTSSEVISGSGTVTPFWSAFLTGEAWLLFRCCLVDYLWVYVYVWSIHSSQLSIRWN